MCFVPSVSLMAQTLLTCYFPEDFNKTKTNVAVYHNKGGDTGTAIMQFLKNQNFGAILLSIFAICTLAIWIYL